MVGHIQQIERAEMRMIRWMCRVSLVDRLSSGEDRSGEDQHRFEKAQAGVILDKALVLLQKFPIALKIF